jgi:IclR family pca regulon transcriptional regulator
MGSRSGAQLTGPRFSQSLETGLLVMKAFTPEHPVQGIAEVASRMRASRSTIHRYMTTLVGLGMLEQDHTSRRYRLGSLPNDLGAAALASQRAVRALDGELTLLRRRTGCTACLALLVGRDAIIAAQERSAAKGQGLLGVSLRRGAALPAHATALGKALLSGLDRGELKKVLSEQSLTRYTTHTITSKRRMLSEIVSVGELGFAVENEEHETGVVAIAVPVRDLPGGPVGALGLVGCMPEVGRAYLERHLGALRESAATVGGRVEPAEPLRPRR